MRKIKFRTWNPVLKRMSYSEDLMSLGLQFSGREDSFIVANMVKGEDVDEILMQFIGLKDKQGKEIYEGDIVKSSFRLPGKEIYKVEWVQRNAEFAIQPEDVCKSCVELIGNIYEHPELCEVTDD